MNEISLDKQKLLLDQIKQESKEYQYNVYDWDVDTIYKKFTSQDNLSPELFIPTYQRNFTWSKDRQSKFIESLFMNLPIPFVFLNRVEVESENGLNLEIEIVDGSQRIRTLQSFIDGELKLSGLEYVTALNGVHFFELPIAIQRKFKMMPIRAVVFAGLPLEKRKEMFKRINSSADELKPQEKRKGVFGGIMYGLLIDINNEPLFQELCPLSEKKKNREEGPELILRYFAYKERFSDYSEKVEIFLNKYIQDKNKELNQMTEKDANSTIQKMKEDFLRMLQFVKENIPHGFRKKDRNGKYGKLVTSSTYFESIAVGIGLAQDISSELHTDGIVKFLESKNYRDIVSSDAANNKSKFQNRINIMKDFLLNK